MTNKTLKKTSRIEVRPQVKVLVNSELFGVHVDHTDEDIVELNAEFNFVGAAEDAEVEVPIATEWDEEENEVRIDISPDWELDDTTSTVRVEASIKVCVPDGVQLTVESDNGGVSAANITGDITLRTENGGLSITDSDGRITLETENGRMQASGCSGEAKISGENGSIDITKCHFTGCELENENGRALFEFTDQTDGKFTFENENGRIHLVIPDEIEFDIEAETENGRVHVGVEGEYDTTRHAHKRQLKMVRGAGKVKIIAATENGGIFLSDTPVEANGKQSFHYGWTNHGDFKRHIHRHIHKVMNKEQLHEFKVKMKEMARQMNNLAHDKDHNKDEMRDLGREMGRLGADFGKQFVGVGKVVSDAIREGFENTGMEGFFEGVFNKEHWGEHHPRPPRPPRSPRAAQPQTAHPAEPVEPVEPLAEEINAKSKLQILEMLREGAISVDEAERLLKTLD